MNQVLINLLPYRPIPTGLGRYVERLMEAWPATSAHQDARALVLGAEGRAQLHPVPTQLPQHACPRLRGWLQANGLAQLGVSLNGALRDFDPRLIYSPFNDCLWELHEPMQVITCHDLIPRFYPNSRRSQWYANWWLPRQLERANHLIAISHAVADQLVEMGVAADRIEVIYNGVSMADQLIDAPASQDCLVIARHAKHKNLALALQGFAHVLAAHPPWQGDLIIVGSPDRETGRLRRLELELGLLGRVRWLSHLDPEALQKQIRSSFCLVSPSLMEGFDYPLLEAQAEGLPTLASRIPVHQELHAACSLLFELDDGGFNLAAQLQRLARDSGLWQQLSHAGRSNASQLTVQHQVQQIGTLLSSFLSWS